MKKEKSISTGKAIKKIASTVSEKAGQALGKLKESAKAIKSAVTKKASVAKKKAK